VPSPFSGTLEASLDAILVFTSLYPELRHLTTPLLKDVDRQTDWPKLCRLVLSEHEELPARSRHLLEELLFLVTRTLLPEQIIENRRLMYRAYVTKRNLSNRMALRYDMLRGWKKCAHTHPMVVESVLPSKSIIPPKAVYDALRPHRRAFMPNILPTLIANTPDQPYHSKRLSDCMRHRVTDLDAYLLLTNQVVASWSEVKLLMTVVEVVVQWQWLRENTELMADMDVRAWEDLSGRADECNWVKDQKPYRERDNKA
ncbi:hypothetical protein P280DRAFT_394758, partial [Massarina eburnea CBS 473.64]